MGLVNANQTNTISRRTRRAKPLAIIIIAVAMVPLGLGLIIESNPFGLIPMIIGFLVLGAMTGLFEGSPYRGRGALSLERRRREEEKRKRKPSD